MLWSFAGGVFTWSRVAELLQAGEPEMLEQLQVCERLIERYHRTGRVAFDGPDYQAAKRGVDVMDQLAELADRPTAIAAAEWSEAKVNQLCAQSTQREPSPQRIAA
jgi:hypothetical protein